MHLKFTEPTCELDMFSGGDVLITDVHDLVLKPGTPDLGDDLVGQVATESHTADLGAQGDAFGRDGDVSELR